MSVYFRAYEQLNVKHESLSLITPQFETPLPPLQPAVSTDTSYRILKNNKRDQPHYQKYKPLNCVH